MFREGIRRFRSPPRTCSSGVKCGTGTPFFFPNREALVDLYHGCREHAGRQDHLLSHCTMAPAVVDPNLIRQLSEVLLDKSPLQLPRLVPIAEGRVLVAADRTRDRVGSVGKTDHAGQGRAVPDRGLAERGHSGADDSQPQQLVSVLTLMIGNPGETDADSMATLDLSTRWSGAACSGSSSLRSLLRCTTRAGRANGVSGDPRLTPLAVADSS